MKIDRLSKCMGVKKFEHQCFCCARFPTEIRDEEGNSWLNTIDVRGKDCRQFVCKYCNKNEDK